MSAAANEAATPVEGAAQRARLRQKRAQGRHVVWLLDVLSARYSHHTGSALAGGAGLVEEGVALRAEVKTMAQALRTRGLLAKEAGNTQEAAAETEKQLGEKERCQEMDVEQQPQEPLVQAAAERLHGQSNDEAVQPGLNTLDEEKQKDVYQPDMQLSGDALEADKQQGDNEEGKNADEERDSNNEDDTGSSSSAEDSADYETELREKTTEAEELATNISEQSDAIEGLAAAGKRGELRDMIESLRSMCYRLTTVQRRRADLKELVDGSNGSQESFPSDDDDLSNG